MNGKNTALNEPTGGKVKQETLSIEKEDLSKAFFKG
jgi:hypothetical protein